MAGNGAEHMIAGTESFQAAEITASGGEAVGPKAPNFVPLNPEQFLASNPDYILFAGKGASFVKDPRFSGMAAIKNSHYADLVEDIAVRRGARVDKFVDAVSKFIAGSNHG